MIVHRFMSKKEFRQLERGEVLTNRSTHPFERTTSVGFCFFAEQPQVAVRWLGGVVETDYCVTFDVPRGLLSEGTAEYRDPDYPAPAVLSAHPSEDIKKIRKKEYCCISYSKRDFRIVSFTRAYSKLPSHSVISAMLKRNGYQARKVDKSDLY